MLEKIDKFIENFLSWKVFKNILLAEICLIPHSCIVSVFNIPTVPLIVMNLSFGVSVVFFTKAIKNMKNA